MADLIGARLGDFEVVRELGRGGMGVVYEARQVSLNRKVALKVLSGGLGLTDTAVQRFRREAEAAARLHHTNIVPVYATGEENGCHFYAMELIDGPSLDHVIKQLRGGPSHDSRTETPIAAAVTGPYVPANATPPLSGSGGSGKGTSAERFDRAAAMIADVADALHHAHQQGVTHRDVKPSNLLLSSDGRLSVTDFGLARMLEQPGMTVTGEFVGTPAYVSPEQVTAGRVPVDHRTDVYSLGATLYELLTLRPPFTAKGRDQLLALVIQKDPLPPRSIDPTVPRDLETVCLKCLEKDPDSRYSTAKELADDLRRFVNRFVILAKRTGPMARAKKWAKRNPALSAAGLMVLVTVLAAGVFAWRAHEAEQLRSADRQKRDEEAVAEKRRAVIERGMVAALAADVAGAEKAVEEAELLGASPGEIRTLRGFIAFHVGNAHGAVAHLEQAVRLLPGRVIPLALLALVYGEQGDYAAWRTITELKAMAAETPEDKLFKGSAIAADYPTEGLQLIKESLDKRPSTLGHVLQADALLTCAQETGTVAAAEEAVASAEVAKRLMPDNPMRLGCSSRARLTAAGAYERIGNSVKATEHVTVARRDAQQLARFGSKPSAIYSRFEADMAFDGLDGKLDRTAELRAARVGRDNRFMTSYEAHNWLCLGNDREAEAVAGEYPGERLNGHVLVFAALGRPGGRADARAALDRFAGPRSAWHFRVEAAPLTFALDPARPTSDIKELIREADGMSPLALEERKRRLAYLDGTLSDSDLLAAPGGVADTAGRYYQIAWKRLGAGDRDGARKAFEEVYRSKLIDYHVWRIARAILIRMKDPKWPQALLGTK
jgi:tetratricopeptide (TPR) repeat protein